MAFGSGLHLGIELHSKLYHDAQDQCSRAIESIGHDAKALLEDAFWGQANIYPPLFRKTQIVPGNDDYSLTLHVAALALGLRHADRGRSELAAFRSEARESYLHRLLRTVIDSQTSVADTLDVLQAVVILSNLEYSCGRYLSATSYLHYAFARIWNPANDVISREPSLSDDDLLIRRALVRVCRFLHMQWMSFHPANLPGLHLPPAAMARVLQDSETSRSWVKYDGDNDSFSIYHALLELLTIVLSITQISELSAESSRAAVFARLCKIETRLLQFRRTIPARFQWHKDTWRNASVPMFLLHLQLCVASVLIYGRLAQTAQESISELPPSPNETAGRYYGKVKRAADKLACSIPQFFERFDSSLAPATMVIQLGVALNALLEVRNTSGAKEQTAVLPGLKSCVAALDKLSERHKLAEDLASLASRHLTSFQSLANCASKSSVSRTKQNICHAGDTARARRSASPPRMAIKCPPTHGTRPSNGTTAAQTGSSVSRGRSVELPNASIWINPAAVIEDPIFPAYSREIPVLFSMYGSEKDHKPVESSLKSHIGGLTNDAHDRRRSVSQQDIHEKAASLTFVPSDSSSGFSPLNSIEDQNPAPGNIPPPQRLPGTDDNFADFPDLAVPGFDIDVFCSGMNSHDFDQSMDWVSQRDLDAWVDDLPVPDMFGLPVLGEMGMQIINS